MKKIIAVCLALALTLGAVAFAETFEGEGEGFADSGIKVAVTVEDSVIKAIEVTENNETPSIGGTAIETLTKQIIDGQTMAVDTVAGATYTTAGFTAAVAEALINAGMDPIAMGYENKSVVILPACMRLTEKLLKADMYHYYEYTTANVCSKYITFMVYEPEMTVWDVRVRGGCDGTSTGFGKLCEGLPIDECIERLSGIQCDGSATGVDSCGDQLAQALTAARDSINGVLCANCTLE